MLVGLEDRTMKNMQRPEKKLISLCHWDFIRNPIFLSERFNRITLYSFIRKKKMVISTIIVSWKQYSHYVGLQALKLFFFRRFPWKINALYLRLLFIRYFLRPWCSDFSLISLPKSLKIIIIGITLFGPVPCRSVSTLEVFASKLSFMFAKVDMSPSLNITYMKHTIIWVTGW